MTDAENADLGTAISRDEVRELVEDAETADEIRVHHRTGLPEQSALQPEETTVELKPDGRWHYVTMFGDPMWFDDDELVEAVMDAEYAEDLELVRGLHDPSGGEAVAE